MAIHISAFPTKVTTKDSGSSTVMVRFHEENGGGGGGGETDVYLYRLPLDDLRAIAAAVADELRNRFGTREDVL